MKTTFDQLDILYSYLKGSSLDVAASGGIYKMVRPSGSGLEDIVINSLPVTGDQIQKGVANVNIYVPDLIVKGDNLPDTARMGVLAALATTFLQQRFMTAYSFWLTNQTIIPEPETSQHYVNLRVDFQFFSNNLIFY